MYCATYQAPHLFGHIHRWSENQNTHAMAVKGKRLKRRQTYRQPFFETGIRSELPVFGLSLGSD